MSPGWKSSEKIQDRRTDATHARWEAREHWRWAQRCQYPIPTIDWMVIVDED